MNKRASGEWLRLAEKAEEVTKTIGIITILFLLISVAQAEGTQEDYGLLWSYETGGLVNSVSVSSDGSYIAAGSDDTKVYFFNREGKLIWGYKTGYPVCSVSVSSDGSYIAAGSMDYNVYYFNREGKLIWSYETGDQVWGVSVSSDGSYIAAGSRDNNTYFFNREGKLIWSYKTGKDVKSVSVSSDGSYIAAGSGDNNVYFFDNLKVFAEDGIREAKKTIESEKAKGFNMAKAEALLFQAEQALSTGKYEIAKELVNQAMSIAIDIDGDGVLNSFDFAPTINNNYIYIGGVVLIAAFTGAGFVVRRNKKKRKEYLVLKTRYEQLKEEGYKGDDKLEEMLK